MPSLTITPDNDPSNLLNTLLGDTTGLSNIQMTLDGDTRAFGTFLNSGTFTDDPFKLTSGIVLSTGRVIDLSGVNAEDGAISVLQNDLSTDFGSVGTEGDSITIQIDFDVDSTKDNLYFQYVFGSEEFLEYAGEFNDSFSLFLNGENIAFLPPSEKFPGGGADVTINNLASSPFGGFDYPFYVDNSALTGPYNQQTRLDGYTTPLTAKGNLIKNGRNTLIINVGDSQDGSLDSAVFLKGGTFGTVRPPDIPGFSTNALPVAANATLDVVPNVAINLTGLSATDADGAIVSYTIATLPGADQGKLFLTDPAEGGTATTAGQILTPSQISQLFFQATSAFAGSSFTYTATDDDGATAANPAKVTLNRIGSNNGTGNNGTGNNVPPVTADATIKLLPGTTKNLSGLSATDADGTVAYYTIITLPSAKQGALYLDDPITGSIPITPGNLLSPTQISQLFFQATADFEGGTFLYASTDNLGAIDTTPATVSLQPLKQCKPGRKLKGNNQNNKLKGTAGSDILQGQGGNDLLQGLDCHDVLYGGRGNDRIFGGSDDDSLFGHRDNDHLIGDAGNDFLKGGRGFDILVGSAGNDTLYGRQQNDQLQGGNGNDLLVGGLGRDHLLGGNGDDVLSGRRGADRLIGGSGSDRFVFYVTPPFRIALSVDKIDFRLIDQDKIVLSKNTFTALTSESGTGFSKVSEFAVTHSDTLAASSQALIVYSASSRKLFYNVNGADAGFGQGGAFAKLLESQSVSQSDFIIQA